MKNQLNTQNIPHVVIVGGGFGGLRAAKRLAKAPVRITLLDRNNYHLFQPLLYQVATAGVSPTDVAYPLRSIFRRQKNLEFRLAEVTGINLADQQIETTNGSLDYDSLILAVGGETNYFGLESVAANGFSLKGLDDASRIRDHILHLFEQAALTSDPETRQALLTIVVAGGGPTGVEMAGAISELIRLVLAKDFPDQDFSQARVLLLEATDRLLAMLPSGLGVATVKALKKKKVEVRFGATVESLRRAGGATAWGGNHSNTDAHLGSRYPFGHPGRQPGATAGSAAAYQSRANAAGDRASRSLCDR